LTWLCASAIRGREPAAAPRAAHQGRVSARSDQPAARSGEIGPRTQIKTKWISDPRKVGSNNPKYVCRACKNKIPVGDLERVFQEQLRGFVLSEDVIRAHLLQADQEIGEKEQLLGALEAEHGRVKAEMDRLFDLYAAGELPKRGFGERYRPLEERVVQIEDEIPRLKGEIDFRKIALLSSEEVIAEARDLYGRWSDLTAEEKRRIVEAITERITIGDGEIDIDLDYRPTFGENVVDRQRNFRGS